MDEEYQIDPTSGIEFPEGEEPIMSDHEFLQVSGLDQSIWWAIELAAVYAQDVEHEAAERQRHIAGYGRIKP